jgi:hypothetical protein
VREVVELESILDCLRAGLRSPVASCSASGAPRIGYVSLRYLDRERVAISRQGVGRRRGGPLAQALVTRAATGEEFRLDLRYLHSPRDGELRGMDVHRVVRCTRVAREAPGADPAIALVHYQADDTVLCDSAYIAKGAAGRILWSMLRAHSRSGRTRFSNRELRLDESLGLPPGNDNLEARLLVLRRRLAELDCGVALERVGRGRLELRLERPVALTEVPTTLLLHAARPRAGSRGAGPGR